MSNSSANDLILGGENFERKIDCGLRNVNPSRYRRDYYVNNNKANNSNNSVETEFRYFDTMSASSSSALSSSASSDENGDLDKMTKIRGPSRSSPAEQNHQVGGNVSKTTGRISGDRKRSILMQEIDAFLALNDSQSEEFSHVFGLRSKYEGLAGNELCYRADKRLFVAVPCH